MFSFVLLKKTNTQEEAKVFGLNVADPNFVSSTILENVLLWLVYWYYQLCINWEYPNSRKLRPKTFGAIVRPSLDFSLFLKTWTQLNAKTLGLIRSTTFYEFISSAFLEIVSYSLRPIFFVLFEKSNFLREHHLLSCLLFKNV